MDDFHSELESLRESQLYRSLNTYRREGLKLTIDEGTILRDFSSNDYLGLSFHPKLKEAGIEAIRRAGVGATSSRLISGTSTDHSSAEETIATLKKSESALLFSAGFMASMSAIPSVVGKDDTIILDKLSHACLIDAARASGARIRVFPHNNLNRLEKILKSERANSKKNILIIVESVYSMDGDLSPLNKIVSLKQEYGALLLVDEAHALGIRGPKGMGLTEELGLEKEVDLQLGTLGKAAGGAGGYIACSALLKELIINKGRGFIFTTAPPPHQAAIAKEALTLIASEEGSQLRDRLQNYRQIAGNLESAIFPVILGKNDVALSASKELLAKGFLIPAIRYPTVPKNSARLRITLSAAHQENDLRKLLEILESLTSVKI